MQNLTFYNLFSRNNWYVCKMKRWWRAVCLGLPCANKSCPNSGCVWTEVKAAFVEWMRTVARPLRVIWKELQRANRFLCSSHLMGLSGLPVFELLPSCESIKSWMTKIWKWLGYLDACDLQGPTHFEVFTNQIHEIFLKGDSHIFGPFYKPTGTVYFGCEARLIFNVLSSRANR